MRDKLPSIMSHGRDWGGSREICRVHRVCFLLRASHRPNCMIFVLELYSICWVPDLLRKNNLVQKNSEMGWIGFDGAVLCGVVLHPRLCNVP